MSIKWPTLGRIAAGPDLGRKQTVRCWHLGSRNLTLYRSGSYRPQRSGSGLSEKLVPPLSVLQMYFLAGRLRFLSQREHMKKSRQSRINPCASILIDAESSIPAYVQLIEQIRSRVVDGQIEFGDRLPATRQLAASLGVSRRMIVTAYESLMAEGFLETRHGDGTYCVFESNVSAHSPPATGAEKVRNAAIQDGLDETFSIMPLSPKELDSGALSLKAWSSASARAQRNLTASHLFNSVPGGLPSLKEGIARHLLSLRGLTVDPSQIVITAGIRESLDLADLEP